MADGADGFAFEAYDPGAADQASARRILSLDVKTVELRLYRRLRTSADVTSVPAHFVYHLRCCWSGSPACAAPPALFRPSSPPRLGSPRLSGRPPASLVPPNARDQPPWWDALPERYVLQRKWEDIVRFHEALATELAWDKRAGIRKTRAKVPPLPERADIDAWLQGYAATGDARALGRGKPVSADEQRDASLEDLRDLHWIYVEHRLRPYFAQVGLVLRELPTEALLGSKALRRFIIGGACGRGHPTPAKGWPIRTRFLGPLVPMQPDREEIVAAARAMRRASSAPGKDLGGSLGRSLPKL